MDHSLSSWGKRCTLLVLIWEYTDTTPQQDPRVLLGAIINSVAQIFVVGACNVSYPFCQSILFSIANPRMYHVAIHRVPDSNMEFSLHTFPKSILRELETAPRGQWISLFLLPLNDSSGTRQYGWLYTRNLPYGFGDTSRPSMAGPRQPNQPLSRRPPRIPCENPTLVTSSAGPSAL